MVLIFPQDVVRLQMGVEKNKTLGKSMAWRFGIEMGG